MASLTACLRLFVLGRLGGQFIEHVLQLLLDFHHQRILGSRRRNCLCKHRPEINAPIDEVDARRTIAYGRTTNGQCHQLESGLLKIVDSSATTGRPAALASPTSAPTRTVSLISRGYAPSGPHD